MPRASPALILPFRDVGMASIAEVGGKNASLGELLQHLAPLGVRVPDGFAITAAAYRLVLAQQGAFEEIHAALDALDAGDVARLAEVGAEVRRRVESLPLPAELEREIAGAYAELSRASGEAETDVAVRSSATAEDLPAASFAGQQESFLGVRGVPALLAAVRKCMASLFTDRAIVYRAERGFAHRAVALSVGVQKMVRSDLACAGVAFSIDTESGSPDVVMITGSWGLGESVVKGRVDPDEFWVHKPTLAAGHRPILRRERGTKELELVYADGGAAAVIERAVPPERRAALVLDDDEVLELARQVVRIEQHYSAAAGKPTPMDVEWAKDGRTGGLFVVQARPETVHSQRRGAGFESFRLTGKGKVLVRGKSVGSAIGAGPVRVVRSRADLDAVQAGDVLVAPMTDPDWEPVLARAAAVVTDHGGRTCHAAIVSRELGLPCVVGTENATLALAGGQPVTVSCAESEGRVLEGRLPFTRERVDPATLPAPRVPVMLNVGDPDAAFRLAQLPCAGVGLARIEFVVSSWIGAHPMALLYPDRVADAGERQRLAERTAGHASGAAFFVERLASGVARIAAAFFPRPVIVRFSDFKSNEYARLLGGAAFEQPEANPMIGFRGASRYHHDRYRRAFALECRAMRTVRDDMGLTNVKLMIPFCRTLAEGRQVLAEMAANGLVRGERELEVWVMCEIPNNVVLAAEFCELFDGFSIGSNDLTQLTLGIDRDSALLAPLFDERDPGVEKLIRTVTEVAHAHGRKVGLCGQAPSDDPEFAAFLAEIGIDSISVTADAFAGVVTRLARAPTAR